MQETSRLATKPALLLTGLTILGFAILNIVQPNDTAKFEQLNITEEDRHYMVLTVIGEAARQPWRGQAAVAHVILNRAIDGRFGGKKIKKVVTHKWKKKKASGRVVTVYEFEPWMHKKRRQWLLSLNKDNSALYRRVDRLVGVILAGYVPDPTNGALYFLNPEIVKERRKKAGAKHLLPEFARGPGVRIADHVFYVGNNNPPDQDT